MPKRTEQKSSPPAANTPDARAAPSGTSTHDTHHPATALVELGAQNRASIDAMRSPAAQPAAQPATQLPESPTTEGQNSETPVVKKYYYKPVPSHDSHVTAYLSLRKMWCQLGNTLLFPRALLDDAEVPPKAKLAFAYMAMFTTPGYRIICKSRKELSDGLLMTEKTIAAHCKVLLQRGWIVDVTDLPGLKFATDNERYAHTSCVSVYDFPILRQIDEIADYRLVFRCVFVPMAMIAVDRLPEHAIVLYAHLLHEVDHPTKSSLDKLTYAQLAVKSHISVRAISEVFPLLFDKYYLFEFRDRWHLQTRIANHHFKEILSDNISPYVVEALTPIPILFAQRQREAGPWRHNPPKASDSLHFLSPLIRLPPADDGMLAGLPGANLFMGPHTRSRRPLFGQAKADYWSFVFRRDVQRIEKAKRRGEVAVPMHETIAMTDLSPEQIDPLPAAPSLLLQKNIERRSNIFWDEVPTGDLLFPITIFNMAIPTTAKVLHAALAATTTPMARFILPNINLSRLNLGVTKETCDKHFLTLQNSNALILTKQLTPHARREAIKHRFGFTKQDFADPTRIDDQVRPWLEADQYLRMPFISALDDEPMGARRRYRFVALPKSILDDDTITLKGIFILARLIEHTRYALTYIMGNREYMARTCSMSVRLFNKHFNPLIAAGWIEYMRRDRWFIPLVDEKLRKYNPESDK